MLGCRSKRKSALFDATPMVRSAQSTGVGDKGDSQHGWGTITRVAFVKVLRNVFL